MVHQLKKRGYANVDRNTFLGVMAIILWSCSVALARRTTEQLGPFRAGAAVFLLSGVILLVSQLASMGGRESIKKMPRRFLLGCGALFVAYMVALYVALGLASSRLQTIEIGLLNYLWPALTLLFSLWLLGHRARWWLIPGTMLGLAGVFLAMTQGMTVSLVSWFENASHNPAAYCLGVTAAVSWALYSNLSRRWGHADSGGAVPFFMLAAGFVFLGLSGSQMQPAPWNGHVLLEVIALAATTALGYMFWDKAMRAGNMIVVACWSYLTPFLSTVFSCIYLGVMPSGRLWVACCLIIAGSVLSWLAITPPQTE